MSRLIWGVLACGMLACGGGDSEKAQPRQALSGAKLENATGENHPPRIDYAALSADQPRAGSEIEARFDAADPDRDALTFSVTWSRNGRIEQSGEARSWTPTALEKGDRVELRVVASDGELESAPAIATARVGNTAPVISQVQVAPSVEPKRGEPLVATALGSDSDGDEVEYRYQWFVNGNAVRGASAPRFVSSEPKRGDRVRVRVIASDGDDASPPVDSEEVAIVNSPPKFAKFDGFEPSGGMFRHQFQATDPDGDGGMRFLLAEGPRGMEIDPVLGIATWHPGPDATGVIPVQVEVHDAFGASSALRFEITIGATAAATPAAQAESEEP